MTPLEDRVELMPGLVMLCVAVGTGGHHVFVLLERRPGLRRYDGASWQCLLLDSDNPEMVPGGFYFPDESYLRRGKPLC